MTQISRLRSAGSESSCEMAFLCQSPNSSHPVSDNATALTHTDTQTLVQIWANCIDNTHLYLHTYTHTPCRLSHGETGKESRGEAMPCVRCVEQDAEGEMRVKSPHHGWEGSCSNAPQGPRREGLDCRSLCHGPFLCTTAGNQAVYRV